MTDMVTEIRLFVWMEKKEVLLEYVKSSYGLREHEISLPLDKDSYPLFFSNKGGLDFVIIAINKMDLGWCVGEVWNCVYPSEIWSLVLDIQQRANTTCVCLTHYDMPPNNIIDFFKQSASNNINAVAYD